MLYVSSRYYDPEIGRFINADGYILTSFRPNGCNMFLSCYNNPNLYSDINGLLAFTVGLSFNFTFLFLASPLLFAWLLITKEISESNFLMLD
ncbi:MAG: hypothetical protein EGR44_12125 [Ruminococcaceae bacterium]|nr:hypothetical protein [Oscillospiraceae bacterium]